MKTKLIEKFKTIFKENPNYYFNTGGRLEICGNHTDHNHGLCIVANCSLRIVALVNKNNKKVRIKSKGYQFVEFDINDLSKKDNESGSPASLCKGILYKIKEEGYNIGGFDAYIESEIPAGSGVSSSAAIESLFASIINNLYNSNLIGPLTLAKIGRFSENVYFNKPCGLLDQIGTSFSNINYIDFKNEENPLIENIEFHLPLNIYLVKSKGNHGNLSDLYSNIPSSMYKVAKELENKKFLRDLTNIENINDKINNLNLNISIKNKAKHFFIENNNVKYVKQAIINNNVEDFLEGIRNSQKSSLENLENTYVKNEEFDYSPQDLINKISDYLKDNGAVRIHGGGFKGTVIAFVKKEFSKDFENFLKNKLKNSPVYPVKISDKAFIFENI